MVHGEVGLPGHILVMQHARGQDLEVVTIQLLKMEGTTVQVQVKKRKDVGEWVKFVFNLWNFSYSRNWKREKTSREFRHPLFHQ